MSASILTFFNSRRDVGQTSLVFHLAWKLADMGKRVMACDLDPQASLTACFFSEAELEELWGAEDSGEGRAATVFRCVAPLMAADDLRPAAVHELSDTLGLVAGDLALSGFEERLAEAWPQSMETENQRRPFAILTAFRTLMQAAAKDMDASLVLVDLGPNLGAINRSALIASDQLVVPLIADPSSLHGLQSLGAQLALWRQEWQQRRQRWQPTDLALPPGCMEPAGYILQQRLLRADLPFHVHERWRAQVPAAYAKAIKRQPEQEPPAMPSEDPNCIATVGHHYSLLRMARDARKPMLHLTVADGATGSHANATQDARAEYRNLANTLLQKTGLA